MPKLSKRKQKKLEANGYDLDFLSRVQPQGNIDFRPDRYWVSGDGYHTTLHFYEFPSNGMERFWLKDLMLIPGTLATLGFFHANNKEIKYELTNSIEEKATRISGKAKHSENQQEIDEINDLMELLQELRRSNVTMLKAYVRVFVSASTKEKLFEKIEEIKDQTSNYKSTILAGEQDFEFHSTFTPPSKQVDMPNNREGAVMKAYDLAGGFFFDHTNLEDKQGTYFGWTPTNGAVNFNFLERDDNRTRSFMILSGNPKMGQQTFLLKHTDTLYAKGHLIRNFDIDGTFLKQTEEQHGLVLDLSGSENRINLFQIFATATDDDGVNVDEEKSYKAHVEKLKSILSVLNDSVTGDDLTTFGNLVNDFYIENDIWYRNPKRHLHELKATKLYNDQYPELEDFVLFLEDRLGQLEAKNPNSREIKAITRIFNTFDELKTSNADMFNGSTEFQDISSEQVVTFDLRGVKGKLLNVQMLSVLSLVSADMTNHGKRCNAMLQEDKSLTEMDMPHTIINVSQAQTLINPRYEKSVESLADMIEIMSSNYGGIVLSVSSLQGILFEEGSGSHKDPYNIAVKKIFGMMQYRVFAQTDETTIPLLANALRGSMNQSELETLPRLTKGQLFMNIAGQGNIVFNQQLLQPELERYGEIR